MPVRQLSKPSVSASASSSSETTTSTTRTLVTAGESASGAVGSSTTISISVLDMEASGSSDPGGDTTLVCQASMTRAALRECARKCSTLGPEQAAFGDQSRHQPRRRDVEGVIGHRRAVGNHAHGFDAPVGGAAGHGRHLVGAALLDRNLPDAVVDTKVDGRRRQCNIERHAIVMRGERLQVGPDLVADIAIGGHPVGADDREIDHAGAASDGRRCCQGSPYAARRGGQVPRR